MKDFVKKFEIGKIYYSDRIINGVDSRYYFICMGLSMYGPTRASGICFIPQDNPRYLVADISGNWKGCYFRNAMDDLRLGNYGVYNSSPVPQNTDTPNVPDKPDDPVNHPAHYTDYPIETIDMMVAIFGAGPVADYCIINAFKYRMRAGKKDDLQQDLDKERWYLDKARELKKK